MLQLFEILYAGNQHCSEASITGWISIIIFINSALSKQG